MAARDITDAFLAVPDNAADITVTLEISGNRLVSILNALDATLFETGRINFVGNDIVGSSPWFTELHRTTEAIRDELSRQRMIRIHHESE